MVIKKQLNIIILGASGTIGKYIFNEFYKVGHNLLVFIKDKKKTQILKKKIKKNKFQEIIIEQLDITNKNELIKKIKKNKNFFKKTNIIINATGVQGEIKNFFKLDLNKFYKTFEINFFSQIIFFRNIYSLIKKNKDISIILFSGGGVTSNRENFSSYTLSKISLVKLVEILSIEFRNKKIRINAIAPGIIQSKMTKNILNQSKKNVKKAEISKIKKEIVNTQNSLRKVVNLITFLSSKNGKNISGKIISSRWDKYFKWNTNKVMQSEIFTLRRVLKIK